MRQVDGHAIQVAVGRAKHLLSQYDQLAELESRPSDAKHLIVLGLLLDDLEARKYGDKLGVVNTMLKLSTPPAHLVPDNDGAATCPPNCKRCTYEALMLDYTRLNDGVS